jgi:type 1 fimbriae regulatory protein FimB/type 1 fimbriae regulatory protein FimE
MQKKTTQSSNSVKSRKKPNLPPNKPKNIDRRKREYLTPAEVKDLREAARAFGRYGDRDHLMILIAYRHALRVSELCDLRWEQIDFKDSKLHVARLKNGDPSVHYLLGDEIRMLRALQRDFPESPFVFSSQKYTSISPRTFHDIVARAGKDAGIKFSVHPHMLRHSKGFQLASKGNDTRAIQAYMGHKNIQHTVLYTKLDPSRFKNFGRDS